MAGSTSIRCAVRSSGVGAPAPSRAAAPDHVIDLPEPAVLPGLVNAHTHLELSHLAGAVAPADSFVSWVRAMLGVRFGSPASVAAVTDAVVRAIGQMEATGTAGVGDIGNTDVAVLPLAASSLSGVHFREALGFKRADAARIGGETRLGAVLAQTRLTEQGSTRLVASVAPHAPYSTSAPLIQSLAAGYEAHAAAVSSIHLGESPEEVEFLATGTGPFRVLARRSRRLGRHVGAAWSRTRAVPAATRCAPCPAACRARHSARRRRTRGRWPTPAQPSCCALGATDGSARACLPSPRPSRRACGWRSAPTVSPASRT